jgi:hypothetical protein
VGVVTKGKKAGWMQRLRYVTKVMNGSWTTRAGRLFEFLHVVLNTDYLLRTIMAFF